jgi:hypothetical protein
MVKTMLSHKISQQTRLVADMGELILIIVTVIASLLLTTTAHAEEVSKEQMKGLDEQVQEIKSDVLEIATELNHLEERLLYPSNTQVAVFVTLKADDTFLLDSLDLRINGEAVVHHIYSYKEIEALKRGGMQRIYTGNLRSGEHEVQVTMLGKTKEDSDLSRSESFLIEKSVGPKAVEIILSDPGLVEEVIELKEL